VDRRRLVRRAVIKDDVHVEIGRDVAVERLQELLELDRAVPAVQRRISSSQARRRAVRTREPLGKRELRSASPERRFDARGRPSMPEAFNCRS
jgi:hypothetical protein